jgi:two-component system OmpR family sensor kinase
LSAHDASLFAGDPDGAFYFVVWPRNGPELFRSATAPPDETRPERVAGPRGSRSDGTLRECFHYTPSGECILVGRDIYDELTGIRHFAWLLAGVGVAVFVLGLSGGWWVSTRALRPIGDISDTAAKISTGDLTQRIHTGDADSELGQLARVLNDTFARLQSAFDRQVQFTADASHELRTPVSVVLTQTQTALSRERPAAEYRESLAACNRAAQRMRHLIESLLTLARLDSGEAATTREPCDLDRIASEALELLRPLAEEKGVTLELDLKPVCCEGQAEQLAQVVSNLVSNAICHNRPGGIVHVKVTSEPGGAILSVRDIGPGIASEDLPHIFDRFYRSDKARSGTAGHAGLGLAIAKAIVEAHHGTIQVATVLDKGSTFTVRLPGLSRPSQSSAPPK